MYPQYVEALKRHESEQQLQQVHGFHRTSDHQNEGLNSGDDEEELDDDEDSLTASADLLQLAKNNKPHQKLSYSTSEIGDSNGCYNYRNYRNNTKRRQQEQAAFPIATDGKPILSRSGSELISTLSSNDNRKRSANKRKTKRKVRANCLLNRSLSTSSIFAFYATRYAKEKLYLALRTFKSWYHEQLTYHHLSKRMEFNQQHFEQWFKGKGKPFSLRALDRYDQIVIWIAGK